MMNKGTVFVISGPSGSGKDTILTEIFKKRKDLFFSISSITRAMRQGEVQDGKYHFISKDEFKKGLENDEFLEYNEYLGNYYGTPKAPVEEHIALGDDVLIEVDVNGAEKIKEKLPEAVLIFVMPPSFDVLYKRLSGRGTETEEQIKGRMEAALKEIAKADMYTYIVVNDDLDDAVDDVLSIMRTYKLELEKQKNIIDEVLNNAKSRYR